jgi:hypothetical protein
MKRLFITIIVFLLPLGCSVKQENIKNEIYSNENLTIAIIGSFSVNPGNVKLVQTDLNNIPQNIDALFITKETFHYSLLPRYSQKYKDMQYPVFFVGLNQSLHSYIENGNALTESTSQGIVQYYQSNPNSRIFGSIIPPDNNYNDQWVFEQILKTIIELRNL